MRFGWSVLFTIYRLRVTSPLFGNNQCRYLVRLYFVLYTDRVTSPFFRNEQRRDLVRLYYRLHTDRVTSPMLENEQRRDLFRLHYVLDTDRATSRRCLEMSNGEIWLSVYLGGFSKRCMLKLYKRPHFVTKTPYFKPH